MIKKEKVENRREHEWQTQQHQDLKRKEKKYVQDHSRTCETLRTQLQ